MDKLILLACFVLLSCNGDKLQYKHIDELVWLAGNWEMEGTEGVLTETWQKETDTSFTGSGVFIGHKGDTLFAEHLRLIQDDTGLSYRAIVPDQNEGQEVVFNLKSISGSKVVFENLSHDFPQRIVYQNTSDSTMHVAVEGMQEDKWRKEVFDFKRKP